MCVKIFLYKKTNHLLLADCRHLVHLFSCRYLQMWSTDCRHIPAEKTNSTCMFISIISHTHIYNFFFVGDKTLSSLPCIDGPDRQIGVSVRMVYIWVVNVWICQ
ncbi:hypothetical protein Hanom_Chr04g00284571 [Helianthus anomalus]